MIVQQLSSSEKIYQAVCERVSQFKDKLGLGVDPGIFDTVVALNLAGLTTYQSCEGHLDHGSPYPWVTVIDQETSRVFDTHWLRVCELEEQAKEAGTQAAYDRWLAADVQLRLLITRAEQDSPFYHRLTSLLDAFYGYANASGPLRLLVKKFRASGLYRIEPGFADSIDDIPERLKISYLERGRAEMTAFAAFLKRQVFHEKLRPQRVIHAADVLEQQSLLGDVLGN
jgi:hypothetical protein